MKFVVHLAVAAVGLAAISLAMSQPAEAQARCTAISVTADAGTKADAVARSQAGLEDAIRDWASSRGAKSVRVTPQAAKPQPYWRDAVTPDLFLKPDVRTARNHTVCWRGVISPAVCTSGSRVCS